MVPPLRAFVHCLATDSAGWLPFADGVAETGCAVAFAVICCIQYAYHLYYVAQTKKKANLREKEFVQLTVEREGLEKDRLLARLENELLREFVSSPDVRKACWRLLKHFVPDSSHQFAAFLRLDDSRLVVEESRGLSKTTRRNWALTLAELPLSSGEDVVCLKGQELRQSELWNQLSAEDRQKTEEIFVFPIERDGSITGGFLTTALYPTSASRSDQVDLTRRVMSGIGGTLRQRMALKAKVHELRFTEELLQLRSLTDRTYASPWDMVHTYLAAVQSMLNADGAILFLKSSDSQRPWNAMVRCLADLNEHLWTGWEEHALKLLGQFPEEQEIFAYDANALKALGIETLMRSALLVPLHQNQHLSGIFCFARRTEVPFDAPARQLAGWAAQHLGKTLVHVQSLAEIKRLAHQDSLTELANRRTFDEQLDREIRVAHRAKTPCSLLLCDLDRFKSINDAHGHLAGDEVLKIVARILQQAAQKTPAGERALTARYGGEELAIILPGQAEDVAHRVAEEIRKSVFKETIWWQKLPIRLTMSIGVATYPTHASSVKNLIESADEALYHAKAQGRNCVSFPPLLAESTIAR